MARTLTAPKPPEIDRPSPASLPDLRRKAIDAQVRIGRLTRSGAGGIELLFARTDLVLSRLNLLRPVRVLQLYVQRRGPLMAAGLAYRLFFAIAALLVVGFATLGIVIAGNDVLRDIAIDALDRSVPGLIKIPGEQEGLLTATALFSATSGLGWAIVVSAAVMVVTSLGWIGGMRQAMRGIFALRPVAVHPVLLRMRDLGTLLVLGVIMLVTTALGVVANNTLGAVLSFLDLEGVSQVLTQGAGFLLMIILDTLVAVVLLRSASEIDMPRSILLQGAMIAGLGSTLLRTFSTQILGSFSNPLLLSFAVILALFIWFFLLSQVYLVATAWCAVASADEEVAQQRRHRAKAGTLRQRSRRGTQT
ncbi:YihY/virulence factor BrkB family protein [Arthrobacter agilis]|uniref:YihY/virulence factor BrkB family protein n=1 Tax=Arthrobacter agilis TaxID=37921 RepID=UPI0023672DDC|nr:YihY/virulence factor BrkB family protein [Arthrobacter agilis]WDF34169.1 YihY/virulence factor BrkB family protein [Arthrobacter agilis]